VEEYAAGRTPNPCIVCNTWLKFGKLFEYADSIGAEFVATGHYAQLRENADGEACLCRGLDESKDQSYVLFGIDRKLLSRLQFPVGGYRKDEIRQMAANWGLRVAQKRDSQDICFIPDQDHSRFVRQRRDDLETTGDFVATDGEVLGRHNGYEAFTVGQRKGLGLAFGQPRYVVRIEPDTRRVVLGTLDDLACSKLTASRANWLVPLTNNNSASFHCEVKIRYRSPAFPAEVIPLPDDCFRVRFTDTVRGVAPGQAAVCYCEDRVLGGGWIE
jgi:tRNA-specific 2-thiouridylase